MSIRWSGLIPLLFLLVGAPARPGAAQTSAPAYDTANGHWYLLVRASRPLTWTDARAAAAALSYAGYRGHLAAVTSPEENQFVTAYSPGPTRSAQLVLFPNPVLGGQPALGQVSLSGPAGAGGVVVTLTSSNPTAVVVPATVTVPAGVASATFDITTLPVGAPTLVTIGAACSFGEVTATLLMLPLPAPPVAPVALPAPANLAAYFVPGAGVQLDWQDNATDETALAVWRKGGGSDWARIAALPAHTTTYLDQAVTPGVTYTYRVRAIRGSTASEWSNEVTVTVPPGL